jgi:hypothetical protein
MVNLHVRTPFHTPQIEKEMVPLLTQSERQAPLLSIFLDGCCNGGSLIVTEAAVLHVSAVVVGTPRAAAAPAAAAAAACKHTGHAVTLFT